MISYYDLVNFLESLLTEPRSDSIVERLNSLDVNLEGDRYFRFLDHLSLLIQDRLSNAYNNLLDKIPSIGNDDNRFSIEFKEYTDEVSLVFSIASIKLVHEENQMQLGRIIMQTNNKILDEIKKNYLDEDTFIMNTINNAYLEEK